MRPLEGASLRIVVCTGPVCRMRGWRQVERALTKELAACPVVRTDCLGTCARAPNVVVYPNGTWYGRLNGQRAAALAEGLVNGTMPSLPEECITAAGLSEVLPDAPNPGLPSL